MRNHSWTQSVPPRGSGWVCRRLHQKTLRGTHPVSRGGTDCVQVSILGIIFVAAVIVFSPARGLGQETKAPQLELRDLNGRIVRLSNYQGKVVLINFWATWCPPCRAEMPELVRRQREHRKQGLQIIGITYPPEKKDRVRRFARSIKVNYPIILGTRQIKARFSSDETLPLTIVIDRDGKITDIISGILLREEFDEKIKPLLMKNAEGGSRSAKSNY